MGPNAMGQQAETVYRNKDGRKVSLEELEKEEKTKKVRTSISGGKEPCGNLFFYFAVDEIMLGVSSGEMGECGVVFRSSTAKKCAKFEGASKARGGIIYIPYFLFLLCVPCVLKEIRFAFEMICPLQIGTKTLLKRKG